MLPSILPEYLDKYKVCGDLMETLTMVRKDESTFLFRPTVLVDQSQAEGLVFVHLKEKPSTLRLSGQNRA